MDDPFPGIFVAALANPDIYFLIANGLIILLLFVGSALISGSEVAYFSISAEDINQEKDSQSLVNLRILQLLSNPKRLLATILILNNFINIAIVMISSYLTVSLLGSEASSGTVFATLTIVMTFLIVFIGEIVPKVYANQNRLQFAKYTSIFISLAYRFFKPLAWIMMQISHVIESRIEKKGYSISVDELHQALEITAEHEASAEEKGILKGIVNFGTLSVKQIMKSRIDITSLELTTDFYELMNQVNKTGYSRIPVFNETIDKIEGILYIKDLLPFINEAQGFEWQKLLRPGFFVPETKKIDTLFRDFQEKRIHIAIVVDEYGGTSGLITMEDVIEEIVGEINDEFDEDSAVTFNKLDANTYVFEGKTSLLDFCKFIEMDHHIFDEAKGESESLGGLLLELNQKLPHSGDRITFENFVFTIVAVNDKRIKKVRVYINR